MTSERWQQIKSILHEAMELAPDRRGAFLDVACSEDMSLRKEVQSLLVADQQVRTSFLESQPQVHLAEGTRLGDYEIQTMLGAGGMGEVYRAIDLKLRREVAIKVLPEFFSADPGRMRRFEQEAAAAAALNHPNILSVYQMGTYQNAPYLVSELLEGETLRAQIGRGPMPVRRVLGYAAQIGQGLAAAHEKGIIHRDLKPENLFVTNDGRVKILDFGLAKLVQREIPAKGTTSMRGDVTETGTILGTAGYMSPEQVRAKSVDVRSDIFAFGVIIREMLLGKNFFIRDTAVDTLSAILNEDAPPIATSMQDISPALDRVIRRSLEKDCSSRFQSVRDFGFALEAVADSGAFSSGDALPAGRRLDGATIVSQVARLTHERGFSEWPTWSPDGNLVAFSSNRSGNFEIYIRRIEGGQELNITHDASQNIQPAISPDGTSIAFVSTRSSRTSLIKIAPYIGFE